MKELAHTGQTTDFEASPSLKAEPRSADRLMCVVWTCEQQAMASKLTPGVRIFERVRTTRKRRRHVDESNNLVLGALYFGLLLRLPGWSHAGFTCADGYNSCPDDNVQVCQSALCRLVTCGPRRTSLYAHMNMYVAQIHHTESKVLLGLLKCTEDCSCCEV